MANYKETTAEGTTWRRAKQVIINNDFGPLPKPIVFMEEDLAIIGDNEFHTNRGSISTVYNPDELINLRDPETGEKTGVMMQQSKVYLALYSLYLDSAEIRDIEENPLPPPQVADEDWRQLT
jgi:hypothetical protein